MPRSVSPNSSARSPDVITIMAKSGMITPVVSCFSIDSGDGKRSNHDVSARPSTTIIIRTIFYDIYSVKSMTVYSTISLALYTKIGVSDPMHKIKTWC